MLSFNGRLAAMITAMLGDNRLVGDYSYISSSHVHRLLGKRHE